MIVWLFTLILYGNVMGFGTIHPLFWWLLLPMGIRMVAEWILFLEKAIKS